MMKQGIYPPLYVLLAIWHCSSYFRETKQSVRNVSKYHAGQWWFVMNRYVTSSPSNFRLMALFLLFVFAIAVFASACKPFMGEPLVEIRVHNQTDEILNIFNDGEVFVGQAIPGGGVMFELESIYPEYEITAKDMNGNMVYSASFTRDDIKGEKTYDVYFPPETLAE